MQTHQFLNWWTILHRKTLILPIIGGIRDSIAIGYCLDGRTGLSAPAFQFVVYILNWASTLIVAVIVHSLSFCFFFFMFALLCCAVLRCTHFCVYDTVRIRIDTTLSHSLINRINLTTCGFFCCLFRALGHNVILHSCKDSLAYAITVKFWFSFFPSRSLSVCLSACRFLW